MISFLYKHFVGWASIGLFTVIILLAAVFAVVICKTRNNYVIREMKTAVDALLALASLLIFMPTAQYLLGAIMTLQSVATSSTGDPRVIMGGIAQVLIPYFVGFSGFIIIYVIWGGLRLLQGKAILKLNHNRTAH